MGSGDGFVNMKISQIAVICEIFFKKIEYSKQQVFCNFTFKSNIFLAVHHQLYRRGLCLSMEF